MGLIWLLHVFRRKKKTSTLDQGSKLTPWHGTLIGSLFWPSLHGKKLLFLMVFLACSLVATKDCCMQVLYWYILVYFMMYFAGYLGPRLMTTVIWYTRVRVGCSQHNRAETGRSGYYTHALRRVACQITFLATTSLVSFRVWTFWDRNPSSD